MPTPPPEAATRAAQRQVLVAAAAASAARSWAQVDAADIAGSWARQVLPAVYTTVSAAQLGAAQGADVYVQAALAAQGVAPAAEYALAAASLAGVAADGRDLASLLYQPAVTALAGIRSGQSVPDALALAAAQLDLMVSTEVADAGRVADGIATVLAPAATGYVRVVVGETCARCILLAGRVYPWSQGFERHPRCDCLMIPVGEADVEDLAQSPEQVYAALSPAERSKAGWSRAEQQAIADGADIARVTNIHRNGGVYVAGGRKFTREGATRRRPRITPEQIYREANGDRAEAVRLLRLHNYIR